MPIHPVYGQPITLNFAQLYPITTKCVNPRLYVYLSTIVLNYYFPLNIFLLYYIINQDSNDVLYFDIYIYLFCNVFNLLYILCEHCHYIYGLGTVPTLAHTHAIYIVTNTGPWSSLGVKVFTQGFVINCDTIFNNKAQNTELGYSSPNLFKQILSQNIYLSYISVQTELR